MPPPIEAIAVDYYRTLTGKDRREPTGYLIRQILLRVFEVPTTAAFADDFDLAKPLAYADPVAGSIPALLTATAVRHGAELPDMNRLIAEIWTRVGDHPLDGRAVQVAQGLHQLGWPLVLASNMVRPGRFRRRTLEDAGLGFMRLVCSSEVGYGKPDPRFYEQVSRAAGVSPERILFVGDDRENDVLGPTKAGMQAAWIDNEADPGLTPAVAVDGTLVLAHFSQLPGCFTTSPPGHITDLRRGPSDARA
ncbi:HAD family hydrolase [Streptomyces aculeolatus]